MVWQELPPRMGNDNSTMGNICFVGVPNDTFVIQDLPKSAIRREATNRGDKTRGRGHDQTRIMLRAYNNRGVFTRSDWSQV